MDSPKECITDCVRMTNNLTVTMTINHNQLHACSIMINAVSYSVVYESRFTEALTAV